MTKQHIDRLKELMLKSADLTEPMDYFLQHVITDAEIVRTSQPAASALLLHVILGLVERHCGQELFVLAPFFRKHSPRPVVREDREGCEIVVEVQNGITTRRTEATS